MVTCGLSVFCLLVGMGTWPTGSPAPVSFPSRPLWIIVLILLILAGLSLCLVWYRLGYKNTVRVIEDSVDTTSRGQPTMARQRKFYRVHG